jgi:hypothetical protein
LPEVADDGCNVISAGSTVVLGKVLHRTIQQHERRHSTGGDHAVPPPDG